jgi:hypothetical protein
VRDGILAPFLVLGRLLGRLGHALGLLALVLGLAGQCLGSLASRLLRPALELLQQEPEVGQSGPGQSWGRYDVRSNDNRHDAREELAVRLSREGCVADLDVVRVELDDLGLVELARPASGVDV